eukprot:COSAG06_NODE_518_length_14769_cov_75.390048_4_plen_174_part_00
MRTHAPAPQAIASVGSGIFHVYSGGIVIDTLKTRLQNGQTLRQALLVTGRESTSATELVRRYARRQGAGAGVGWLALVRRCNLAAGHLITAMGRFPYLFLNLGTYSQAEQWCLRRSGGVQRPLTVLEVRNAIFAPFYTKKDHFTEAGSGQTQGKLKKRDAFSYRTSSASMPPP